MSDQSILVVDDEAKMRRLLGLMLEQLGYEVLSAGDGEAALARLSEGSVDLMITDLRMPRMDGMTLLRTLREQGNPVAVIMVTAHGEVESAVEAMKYGASDYIVRPFDLDAIEAAVKRALKMGQVQRENRFLRNEVDKGWSGFVGTSAAMQSVYRMIEQVGPTKTSVLIQGETGTGKELAARAIHRASPRADYRLNVFTLELPPLRARRNDIGPLADYFLEKHAAELGCLVPTIDARCAVQGLSRGV